MFEPTRACLPSKAVGTPTAVNVFSVKGSLLLVGVAMLMAPAVVVLFFGMAVKIQVTTVTFHLKPPWSWLDSLPLLVILIILMLLLWLIMCKIALVVPKPAARITISTGNIFLFTMTTFLVLLECCSANYVSLTMFTDVEGNYFITFVCMFGSVSFCFEDGFTFNTIDLVIMFCFHVPFYIHAVSEGLVTRIAAVLSLFMYYIDVRFQVILISRRIVAFLTG